MITVFDALYSLTPTAEFGVRDNTYGGIDWFSSSITKPTEQEVNDEIARLTTQKPLDACATEAKGLLAISDWSVLPDVNISNKAEFESYRAQLRTLVFNPVEFPDFPSEPQPSWM